MTSSVVWVLGVFVSGLALNLTPCVYPMLSVTVALFGHKHEQNLAKSFTKALLYVAGIAATYSAFGVVAALTGKVFGAALQSPWILGAISVLMFLLALSMFGVYELRAPSALIDWIGSGRRAGLFGIFFSGLCVGIFAAPCIGPPIVALLALVGQTADPISGFLIFFIMSLGLGLPYLILGTFSGLLRKIPKSGEWLLWVKKIFGVALLGFSFFYAVLALHPPFLSFVVPVTLIGGGLYLGFLDRSAHEKKFFRRLKWLAGACAIMAGSAFFVSRPAPGVVWEPYSSQKLALAAKAGQPVIVDFYADWCIPCHELERFTYTNPGVIQALTPFARLKVDVTNPDTPEAVEPIERFDVIGVPTVLFLDPKGREVRASRITGFAPPEDFLAAIKTVALPDTGQ